MILFIFGCVEWGLLWLRCSAPHCGGFSCEARALGHVGSAAAAPRLQSTGVVLEAHGRACSSACGIFPDQGSNLCLLHWHVDSLSLRHQESPPKALLIETTHRLCHMNISHGKCFHILYIPIYSLKKKSSLAYIHILVLCFLLTFHAFKVI